MPKLWVLPPQAAQATELKKRQEEHAAFLLHQIELNKRQRDNKRAIEEQVHTAFFCFHLPYSPANAPLQTSSQYSAY